ncbi:MULTISPECIES: DUF4123 domain-containing protein [unclassified Photobacterium]|uniref:DUF4123 domain-containing protein n=1 Tax=unclassified Photobacterium TaxID=2628852 RepID=UPI000D158791|nr:MULTISPECIES: DUF4123 domain-containing protein [unclassified Photobacterium]PSV31895.1 hypothetical protein C9J38_21180 [Photobacterium sp. GB-210]PSV50431.1 hypothetical protein C9J45_20060 [Photobacterium sp. GB-1]
MLSKIENIHPLYWVVNHESYKEVLNSNASYLESAEPLFTTDHFHNLVDVSPWVIKTTNNHKSLNEALLTKGIMFEAPSYEMLIAHLRSLLMAGYQGESVMFRFYDPDIFNAVYQKSTLERRVLFLGAAHRVYMTINGEQTCLENPYPDQFSLQQAPWWVLNDEDFSELYNINNHAYCVSRRLWQNVPELMEKLSKKESDLTALFHQGSLSIERESLEFWTIAQLIVTTHTPSSLVIEQLRLDRDEQKELQYWLGKIS